MAGMLGFSAPIADMRERIFTSPVDDRLRLRGDKHPGSSGSADSGIGLEASRMKAAPFSDPLEQFVMANSVTGMLGSAEISATSRRNGSFASTDHQ
jgi:hypothetical protein